MSIFVHTDVFLKLYLLSSYYHPLVTTIIFHHPTIIPCPSSHLIISSPQIIPSHIHRLIIVSSHPPIHSSPMLRHGGVYECVSVGGDTYPGSAVGYHAVRIGRQEQCKAILVVIDYSRADMEDLAFVVNVCLNKQKEETLRKNEYKIISAPVIYFHYFSKEKSIK